MKESRLFKTARNIFSISEDENDFAKIAAIMLDELSQALAEKNITFTYSQPAAEYIAENSYSKKFGARNMRRFIRANVEDLIAERIVSDYGRTISGIALKYSKKENKLVVECI